jgi:two-component system, response regulator, stage 0 sporulation protein F
VSRILIVDDDQRIVQLLSDCFKHAHTVDIAMNGGEALAIIRRQRPDVVLLDLMLPGISGVHLLKEIKKTDPTIAVVVMTGLGNTAVVDEAVRNGAASYLAKPFNLPEIDRLVTDIIARLPRTD